jgi:hypothetical protein
MSIAYWVGRTATQLRWGPKKERVSPEKPKRRTLQIKLVNGECWMFQDYTLEETVNKYIISGRNYIVDVLLHKIESKYKKTIAKSKVKTIVEDMYPQFAAKAPTNEAITNTGRSL